MPGVGIMWPTRAVDDSRLTGVGLAGSCAVPAGGVAAGAARAGRAGALAGAWAAAGVSPAAARAIAHPISLIFTPVTIIGSRKRRVALPDLRASIGAASGTLKR